MDIRASHETQQENCKVVYDKITKVFIQKAQVTEKYAESFTEAYVKMADARYKGKNPMFNLILEQNPEFSPEMFKDLSQSIEGLRSEFAREQKKLLDKEREFNLLLKKFPTSIFMGFFGEKPLESKLVLSTKVNESFETGVDDDVDLF